MLVRRILAAVVFASLLASFLSPAFAWHMKASHDELAHEAHAPATADGHDHPHDRDASHEHTDPHSQIGHLFSHLPSLPSETIAWAPPAASGLVTPAPVVHIALRSPEPPFRPPRA